MRQRLERLSHPEQKRIVLHQAVLRLFEAVGFGTLAYISIGRSLCVKLIGMVSRNYCEVYVQLKRTGSLIEIVDTGVSVAFHPDDIQKTFDDVIKKCAELDPDHKLSYPERRDIDAQLTEIY